MYLMFYIFLRISISAYFWGLDLRTYILAKETSDFGTQKLELIDEDILHIFHHPAAAYCVKLVMIKPALLLLYIFYLTAIDRTDIKT